MAFMERSHRGHETNGAVIVELLSAPLAKVRDLAEDFDGGIGYDLIPLSKREEFRA